MGRRFLEALVIGLVVGAGIVVLWSQGTLDRFENKAWDMRASYLAKPGPHSGSIKAIFLDQASLDWGTQEKGLPWPWPRETYFHILKFCRRARAKAVIFDVIFTEPSRDGVPDDELFGEGIEKSDCFVGTVFVGTKAGTPTWPGNVPVRKLDLDAPDEWRTMLSAENLPSPNASFPIPEVAAHADMLGDVSGKGDDDGVFRRTHMFRVFDGKTVPSLGLAAFVAPNKITDIRVAPDGTMTVGDTTVPLDREGRAILRYRGASQTHQTFNAASIIESELRIRENREPVVKPEVFEGSYVFFGYTAHGLYDLKPTPVSGKYPGVEIHATVLDNLLSNDFIRELPHGAALAYSLICLFLCSVAVRLSNRAWKTFLIFCFLVPVPALLGVAAYDYGFWLPIVLPMTGVICAFAFTVVVKWAVEGRRKRFIKNAFKQYLSHDVINALMKHPERLKLGGEKKVLSIFFSDLEGFTSISENMDAEDLTEWLNQYLSAMSDIIKEEQGTIDKYEGDAIIAFWNAPLSQPDHAIRAVRAALKCQQRLVEIGVDLRKKAGRDVAMRIGIHTGAVTVGNMGSASRFDYTIIGDAANLASRLEGINKFFGTRTLISEQTLEHVRNYVASREISTVAVKGKSKPVKVFEPMSKLEYTKRRYMIRAFNSGLEKFYEGDFKEAHRLFSHTKDRDPVAHRYAVQCEELMSNPPEDWNAVWVMEAK